MTLATLDAPAPPRPHADAGSPDDAVRLRLQHLFRHTLRAGQINPLLHIMLRHRLGKHP